MPQQTRYDDVNKNVRVAEHENGVSTKTWTDRFKFKKKI